MAIIANTPEKHLVYTNNIYTHDFNGYIKLFGKDIELIYIAVSHSKIPYGNIVRVK